MMMYKPKKVIIKCKSSSDDVHHDLMMWWCTSSFDHETSSCLLQNVKMTTWINNYQTHARHWHSHYMQSNVITRFALFQKQYKPTVQSQWDTKLHFRWCCCQWWVVSGGWWGMSGECACRPGAQSELPTSNPKTNRLHTKRRQNHALHRVLIFSSALWLQTCQYIVMCKGCLFTTLLPSDGLWKHAGPAGHLN